MDLSKFSDFITELDKERKGSDNIFKILRQETYENKHSTFLSWLFDIDASHGFEDKFADKFFKKCFGEDCDIDCKQIKSVKTEVRIAGEKQKKEGKDKRRIDILIVGDGFTCTIENKYGSTAHGGQCTDYREYIEGRKSKFDKPTSDGKYPLSEGWRNFFVFLDIETPKDFENEHTETYADYDFISYKEIKEILNELVKDIHVKNTAITYVEQYIDILEEKYKPLSEDIWKKCQALDLLDVQQIIEISDYDKYTSEEVVFIDVVKQYYRKIKGDYDKEILECLKSICTDEYYFKGDYGHGKGEASYAYAIPAFVDDLDLSKYLFEHKKITVSERKDFKDIMKRNAKDSEKDRIKGIIKDIGTEKNELKADKYFKTVDYRAPRDGNPNIHLAIAYGLVPDYSENIASVINRSTIESLNKLIEDNWDVGVKFYFKTGAGTGDAVFDASFDFTKLKDLTDSKIQELFNKEIIGKSLDYSGLFSKTYFSYLDKIRSYLPEKDKYSIENYMFNKLIISNEKKIRDAIDVIEQILKDKKCRKLYETWLESNKVVKDLDEEYLLKKLTDCGQAKNKKKIIQGIDNCFIIINFKLWMTSIFKVNSRKFQSWEDVDDDVMNALVEVIDKLPQVIDDNTKDGSDGAKEITKYIMKAIDKRDNVERISGIQISVTKSIIVKDESNRSIELQQGFYKNTLDGLSLFEEYQKWFEENVFKPKADLIKMGLDLE